MSADELKLIIETHALWIKGDPKGKKADLQYANLQSADLQYTNLQYANLQYANLQSANLQYTNLQYANLQSADLRSADLQYADLRSADLRYANLQYANLRYANLREIKNAGLVLAQTEIQPREGEVIGWKKCIDAIMVKVRVPANAKRSNSPASRKCRAEYVEVIEVIGGRFGTSIHDNKTIYLPGTTVLCDKWCEDRFVECGGGIHYFITREEAEAYCG